MAVVVIAVMSGGCGSGVGGGRVVAVTSAVVGDSGGDSGGGAQLPTPPGWNHINIQQELPFTR